jgi:hypothetical protein
VETTVDAQALSVATELIGLDAKWLQPFDVEDPFNDNLPLRGFLCQKPDYRPFFDMWQELLRTHPTIPQLVEANGCHISFEMYGARNAHLVLYERELTVPRHPTRS